MKAVWNGNVSTESSEFQDIHKYVLEIGGKWFELEDIIEPWFDPPEEQRSANVYKWVSRGKVHRFRIRMCKPPKRDLPEEAQRFIDHHLETGCQEAELNVLAEGRTCREGGSEGWQNKETKD